MRIFAPLAAIGLLSACMGDTMDSLSTRDAPVSYGAPLTQSECKQIARKNIEPFLFEPRSARYVWGTCEATTLGAKPLKGLPKQSGYAITLEVDAKNGFGYYAGYTEYEILIRDGEAIRRQRETQKPGIMEIY